MDGENKEIIIMGTGSLLLGTGAYFVSRQNESDRQLASSAVIKDLDKIGITLKNKENTAQKGLEELASVQFDKPLLTGKFQPEITTAKIMKDMYVPSNTLHENKAHELLSAVRQKALLVQQKPYQYAEPPQLEHCDGLLYSLATVFLLGAGTRLLSKVHRAFSKRVRNNYRMD